MSHAVAAAYACSGNALSHMRRNTTPEQGTRLQDLPLRHLPCGIYDGGPAGSEIRQGRMRLRGLLLQTPHTCRGRLLISSHLG